MNLTNDTQQFIQDVANGKARGQSVYFLGIGGIGMSALARYFNSKGVKVSGYDKTSTVLTDQLQAEGMAIHFEDDVRLVDSHASLVLLTPAIPPNHQEHHYFLANGFPVFKRSEVLGMITSASFNICVAGTHGKTTTSAMIAHLLRDSGYGCNAFLGGIASNYNSNFWSHEKAVCVAEADEYDRSFLQLSPDVAVITAMDPDHLDIYGTAEHFKAAFVDFSGRLKPGGTLYVRLGLQKEVQFLAAQQYSYHLIDTTADVYAENLQIENGAYRFDVAGTKGRLNNIVLNMGGLHNVENAIAAIAVARQLGIADEAIRKAVAGFKGVKRRFEYIVRNEALVMIDDYAHHPQELTALINSAKNLFPGKKCSIVFQPHLYSRTRDFAAGFAEALSLADEVVLLPIYPARELPIEGVSSEMIAAMITQTPVQCIAKDELLNWVKNRHAAGELTVLITAGAGDIDTLVNPLQTLLNQA